jgi:hypothetical protein
MSEQLHPSRDPALHDQNPRSRCADPDFDGVAFMRETRNDHGPQLFNLQLAYAQVSCWGSAQEGSVPNHIASEPGNESTTPI